MDQEKVSVISKEIQIKGKAALARLLSVEGQEGMLSTHLAELVNIANSTMSKHIRSNAISAQPVAAHSMRSLKDMDVIPIHAKSAVFLPRDSVRALIKIIDTEEAWAIYRQLWDEAAELAKIKPMLAQALAELEEMKTDRDHINQMMESQQQEIDDLVARFEAASHHISLGGNRKTPKFNLPTYVRQPEDIFKKPSYKIDLAKKSVGEMSDTEHKRFALQHSSKVAVGVSGSLIRTMNELGVNNPMIRDKAELLRDAARDLHSEIMPSEAGLLALNNGYINGSRPMLPTIN